MLEKISIIIPVFNVEKYISDCLLSVCNQVYENIEILVVNDGSSDSSLMIIEDFVQKDNRIKLFSYEKSMGQSYARNMGIRHATGEYIVFVDSDDFVSSEYVSCLHRAMLETQADVVELKGYKSIDEMARYGDFEKVTHEENKVLHFGGFKETASHVTVAVWNKIFKRSIFDEILFSVGLWYEDFELTFKVMMYVDKIVIMSATHYFYRKNSQGVMLSGMHKKVFDLFEIMERLHQYTSERYSMYLGIIDNLIISNLSYWFTERVPFTHEYSKLFWKEMQKYRQGAFKSRTETRCHPVVYISVLGRMMTYWLLYASRKLRNR